MMENNDLKIQRNLDNVESLMGDTLTLFTDMKDILVVINGKLQDANWKGAAHDKCCDINALTILYRDRTEAIFSAAYPEIKRFIDDTSSFRHTSESVKKLENW